jgi:hypothetical protein
MSKGERIADIASKASAHARDRSENSQVYVYWDFGVFYLALAFPDGKSRNLCAVGTLKTGIRSIREEIDRYFADK